MRKLIFLLFTLVVSTAVITASEITLGYSDDDNHQSGITFRSTQKLISSNRYELYLYTNHTFEQFDSSGRLVTSGTWQYDSGEIFFYSSIGLIEKSRCDFTGQHITSLKFNGLSYSRKY